MVVFGGNENEGLINTGKIGKILNAMRTVNDYKRNPGMYTTTTVSEPVYNFNNLKDEGLSDINKYFKGSVIAKDAILGTGETLDSFFNNLSQDAQTNLQPIWDNVKNGTATVEDVLKGSFGKLPNIVVPAVDDSVAQAQDLLAKTGARLGQMFSQFLSVGINAGLSILASYLLSKLIPIIADGIDELLHHSDRIIERGKEAKNELEDIYSTIEKGDKEIQDIAISVKVDDAENKTAKKNLEELATKYAELKKGVNAFTNANKTLSTDKYQEYLKICNEIGKKYPELVKGYDSQGNAILKLGTNVDDCKTQLTDLYDAALNVSNIEISENLATAFAGIAEEVRVAKENVKQYNDELKEIADTIDNIKGDNIGNGEENTGRYLTFGDQSEYEDFYNAFRERYNDWAAEQNKDIGFWDYGTPRKVSWEELALPMLDTGDYNQTADGRYKFYLSGDLEEYFNIDENKEALESYMNEAIKEMEITSTELNQKTVLEARKIAAANAETTGLIKKELLRTSSDLNLNQTIVDAVLGNIGQFDTDYILENFGEEDDMIGAFVESITDFVGSITDEAQKSIEEALNKDYSGMNISDYMNNIYKDILNAVGGDQNAASELMKLTGVSGNIREYFDKRTNLFNYLNPLGMTEEEISGFSLNQIDKGLAVFENAGDKVINSVQEFYKKLNEAPQQYKNDGKLSDVLNAEDYKTQAEIIEKNLSAITTAITAAQETGNTVVGEAAKTLKDAMQDTDFGDFSVKSLNAEALNQLDKWVDLLYSQAKTAKLSEEAMQDLDTYVRNLVMSYKDLGVTAEDVTAKIVDQYKNKFPDAMPQAEKYGAVNNFEERFNAEFEKELGNENDRRILYYLSLDDTSATWDIDKWREEYDHAKITFDLVAETKELDEAIENRNIKRGRDDAENALKKAGGQTLTAEDYTLKIKYDLEDEKDLGRKYANSVRELGNARYEFGKSKNTDTYWKDRIKELEAESDKIYTELLTAQQQTLTDRIAQQNAPLDGLKRELEDLQVEAKNVQNSITELENNGKSATAEQYQSLIDISESQIENLEKQKEFQVQLMDWLANTEGIGADSEYYATAEATLESLDEQIIQTSTDLEQTKTKLDEVFSSVGFEYLLTNTDSDKGIQKIYSTFEAFMQKYKGYLDQIKNGEKLDFSAIAIDIPELAGIDNIKDLQDAIGNLQADKLIKFVSDYTTAISGLDKDSDAFKQATNFLTSALANVDLKNINVDAKSIKDAIFSKIFAAEDGQWASNMFAAINNKIKDGKDLISFIEVSMQPGFYDMTPQKVVDAMDQVKMDVDLEVGNLEEFQNEVARLAAELSNIHSDDALVDAQQQHDEKFGIHTNDENYINQHISNNEAEIANIREQIKQLYDVNNPEYAALYNGSLDENSVEFETLLRKRSDAIKGFAAQILTLKSKIEDLNEQKLLLGADEYTREIDKLKVSNQDLMTELGKYDEYTEVPSDLFADIYTNLSEQAEQYQLKQDFYEKLLGMENISPALETTLNSLISETKSSMAELNKQMAEYLDKEAHADDYTKIKNLESRKSSLQAKQANKTMTQQDYSDLDEINKEIQQIYTSLLGDAITSVITNSDPLLQGGFEALRDSLIVSLEGIKGERKQNKYAEELLPVQDLEKAFADLQLENDKIKDEISDIQSSGNGTVSDDIFTRLSENADLLLNQIELIKQGYTDLADKYKGVDSDKEREYREKAASYDSQENSADADKKTSEEGVDENELNEIQTEALKLSNQLDTVNAKISDTGEATSLEDYQEALSITTKQVANFGKEHEYWNNKLNDGTVEEGSANWKTYSQNLKTAETNLRSAEEEQKKFNKAILDFDLNKLQKDIDQYNRDLGELQNRIKMNEANGIKKSNQDYLDENAIYAQIATASRGRASNLQEQMDNTTDKESDDYLQLVQDQYAALQTAWDAEYNKAQNENQRELLPVEKLKDELAELQLTGTYIQREYDDIIAAGGELSQEQRDVQLANLDSQREKLVDIEHMYQQLAEKHKDDSFGLQMLQALDGVQQQIDEIDDKEIDINLEIDNTELNHLKNQMTDLQNDATKFKSQLDNAKTTSEKSSGLNGLISTSEKQVENLNGQIQEYQTQMDKIVAKYESGELKGNLFDNKKYIELTQNIFTAEQEVDNLTNSTKEYKKALDSLPIERINRAIEVNNADIGLEQAKNGLTEATGGTLGREDYAQTIQEYTDNVELATDALKEAQKQYDNAVAASQDTFGPVYAEAFQEEADAVTKAETDLVTAQTNLANAQTNANQSSQAQFETQISLLNTKKDAIQTQIEVLEAAGKDTSDSILESIDLSNQVISETQAQLADLDAHHENMSDTEYEQKRLQLLQQCTKEEQSITELYKKLNTESLKPYTKQIGKLNLEKNDIQRQIDEYQRNNQKIPEVLLKAKITNIENTIEQTQGELDTLSETKKLLIRFGVPEDDELIKYYEEQIEQLKAEIASLTGEVLDTKDQVDNQPLIEFGYQLDDLKRKAEDFQKVLNDGSKPKNIETYKDAIKNAVDQQDNLIQQMNEVRTKMEKYKDDQGNYNVNDPGYQELHTTLVGLENDYEALSDSVVNWGKEMANLDFQSATTALNEYASAIQRFETQLNNKVSLGYRATEEDYKRQIGENEVGEKLSRNAMNEALERTQIIPGTNATAEGIVFGSNEYAQLVQDYQNAVDEHESYIQKIEELNKQLDWLPIDELQREQKEIQRTYANIERDIVEATQNGQEKPIDLLQQEMDAIDEEMKNLEQQKTEMENRRDKSFLAKFFGRADEIQEQIDGVDSQMNALSDKQYEIQIEINEKPLHDFEDSLSQLANEASSLEDQLNDSSISDMSKSSILQNLQANAEAQKTEITNQIQWYREEMKKLWTDGATYDQMYTTNSMFKQYADTINNLQNQFSGLTRKVKEYGDAIKNLPIERLQNQRETLESRKGIIDSQNTITTTLGGQTDYGAVLDADNLAIKNSRELAAQYKEQLDEATNNMVANIGKSTEKVYVDEFNRIEKLYNEQVASLNGDIAAQLSDALEAAKQPLESLGMELDGIKTRAEAAANDVANLEDKGLMASAEQYEQLIEFNDQQIENIEQQKEEWESYRLVVQALLEAYNVDTTNNTILAEIDQAILQLDEDTRTLTDNTLQYLLMLHGGRELKELQNQMEGLELQATSLSDELSRYETLSMNAPIDVFKKQAQNTREQIANLRGQNEYLREQQTQVKENTDAYRQLESQIQANNSSITTMQNSLDGINSSIDNYAVNVATAMSNAISSALSESMSTTGLSSETMNTLMGQFRELAEASHIDLRSMFVESANGIKVNISALRKLVNAQQSLAKSNFAKQVSRQNKELVKQVQAYKNTSNAANQDGRVKRNAAKQNLQGIKKEVKALDVQMNTYYAMQKALEDQMSGYQKWQNALTTPNPGDHYKEVFNQMDAITKALNDGEIGTDEFKSFFRDYVSLEGRHSSEYAREQWDLLYRYFTEDRSGIENFMNDLVARGFGTISNGTYLFDVQDTEALKKSFGWTDEILKDLFGRARDYGANINYVTSYADGYLQLSDAINDVIEAEEWLSKSWLSNEGRADWTNDLINAENAFEFINKQMEMMGDNPFNEQEYNDAAAMVDTLSEKLSEYLGGAIPASKEEFNKLTDSQKLLYRKFMSEILDIADQYHLELNEAFMVDPDSNSYEQSVSRYKQMIGYIFEEGKKELERLKSEQGYNLDLDYDFKTGGSLEEMQQKLSELKDFQLNGSFNMDTDVQAMETLERIIAAGQDAVDLQIVLDTNNLSKEEFNLLSEDDKIKYINLAFEAHEDEMGGSVQRILDYADGLDIPTKVVIDQTSVDTLGSTIETSITNAIQKAFGIIIKPDITLDQPELTKSVEEQMQTLNNSSIGSMGSDKLITAMEQVIEEYNNSVDRQFGNIDLKNRDVLVWTQENLEKYADFAKEAGIQLGDISTVLGSWDQFELEDGSFEIDVAYSPILQTDEGPQLLDDQTVHDYITDIMNKAVVEEDGKASIQVMLELDNKDNGGLGLIAAINETGKGNLAEITSQLMHMIDAGENLEALSLIFDDLKKAADEAGVPLEVIKATMEDILGLDLSSVFPEVAPDTSSFDAYIGYMKTLIEEVGTDQAFEQFVQGLVEAGDSIEGATEKANLLKQVLEEIDAQQVSPEVSTESIDTASDEADTPMHISKAVTVKMVPEKEEDFEAQAEDIVDKITITKAVTVNMVPEKEEEFEAHAEEILDQIPISKAVTIKMDKEEFDAEREALVEDVESDIVDMPISGDSKLLRQEIQYDEAGIEASGGDMKIGGDSYNLDLELARDIVKVSTSSANIKIGANSSDLAAEIQDTLNQHTFTANVHANVQTTVVPMGSLPGRAAGTVSPAHAKGTTGELKNDEDALVNELGTESIVRDGKWFELEPGMHVEHLERGDVVLNHKQTEELKKTGKASGKGKIVGGESALAQGTVVDGMPAHASFGGTWTPAPQYDLQWHGSEVDDSLDDFVDDVNDAGDGLGDAADAADDFSDGVDDAREKSKQLFDYIEIRLKEVDRVIKRFSSAFNEWMTNMQKTENINQQINWTRTQLNQTGQGAQNYAAQALISSHDFLYYEDVKDADGKSHKEERHLDLSSELNLQDLINGKIALEEIDTSTARGQAIYDAAQAFLNLHNKAESASDQMLELANSLGALYSQMIQLPFDELEKNMSKLERAMSSLSAVMSTETTGESGLLALENVLEEFVGAYEAFALIDPQGGRFYETQNAQIRRNLELQHQQVQANRDAYDAARRTSTELQLQLSSANDTIQWLRQQIGAVYMEDIDRQAYERGEQVDLSHFGSHDYSTRYYLAEYNSVVAQSQQLTYALAESQSRIEEQYDTLQQSAAEYAQALIQSVYDQLANINNFYSSIANYQDSLNGYLKANRDYLIKWYGYAQDTARLTSSYQEEINNNLEKMEAIQNNILAQRQQLNEAINDGTIIAGSPGGQARAVSYNSIVTTGSDRLDTAMAQAVEEYNNSLNRQFGNIDLKNRQVLEWTQENIDKYSDFAREIGVQLGDVSTVLGSWDQFRLDNGFEIDVAYSPILQTDHGPELLDDQTVRDYINDIMNRAIMQEDGRTTVNIPLMLELDDKYHGGLGLIAAINESGQGNLADITSQLMHMIDAQENTEALAFIFDDLKKAAREAGVPLEELKTKLEGIFGLNLGSVFPELYPDSTLSDAYAGFMNGNDQTFDQYVQGLASTGGSQEWREMISAIQDLETELINVRNSINETYSELVDVPNQVFNQRIEEVKTKYYEILSIIDNGIEASATLSRAYSQIADGIARNTGANFSIADRLRGENPVYMNQSMMMYMNLDRENLLLNHAIEALKTAKETYDQTLANPDLFTFEQIKLAGEAYQTALENVQSEMVNMAKLQADNMKAAVENVDSYYSVVLSRQQSLNKTIEDQRKILEGGSYIENAAKILDSYGNSIKNIIEQNSILRESIGMQRVQINYNLSQGVWDVTDAEYINAINHVEELESQIRSAEQQMEEYYKTMMDIPNKVFEEKLESISRKFSELTGIINGGMDANKTIQRLYSGLGYQFDRIFGDAETSMEDVFARMFQDIEAPMFEEVPTFGSAVDNFGSEVQRFENATDVFGSEIDGVNSNLFGSFALESAGPVSEYGKPFVGRRDYMRQNNILSQNLERETEELYAAAETYAQLRANYEYALSNRGEFTADEFKAIEDAFNKGLDNLRTEMTDVAKMSAENARQAVSNIDTEYSTLLSRLQSVGKTIESNRKLLEGGYYEKNSDALVSSYYDAIANNAEQAKIIRQSIFDQERQIERLVRENVWQTDDADYINAINHVDDLKNSLVDLQANNNELYKSMLDLPNKILEEKLERIRLKYLELTETMSKQLDASKALQRSYVEMASKFEEGLGFESIVPQIFGDDRTYIGQNKLLTEGITKQAEDLRNATQAWADANENYNYAVAHRDKFSDDLFKIIEDQFNQASEKLRSSMMEYSKVRVENASTSVDNISKYYTALLSREEAVGKSIDDNRRLLQSYSVDKYAEEITSSYKDSINSNLKQIAIIRKEIAEEQAQIDWNLSPEGPWSENDEDYINASNHIQDLNSRIIGLKINNQELYKTMLDLPNKVIEEKLDSIKEKYLELTAVLEKGLDSTRSYQRAYIDVMDKIDKALGMNSTVTPFFGDNRTYIGQNKLLTQNLYKEMEELQLAAKTWADAKANYEYLTEERQKIQDKIDVSGGINLADDAYEVAEETYKKAQEDMRNKTAEFVKLQIDNANAAIENIRSYYDTLLSREQSFRDSLQANQKLMEEESYDKNFAALIKNFEGQLRSNVAQQNILKDLIAEEEAQIKYITEQEWWTETDEDYINAMNNLDSLRNQLLDLTSQTREYYATMLDIPNKVYEEKLDSIEKKYMELNAVISSSMDSTRSYQRTYYNIIAQLAEAYNMPSDIAEMFTEEETYVGRNRMLTRDINRETQVLQAAIQAYAQARESLNIALNNREKYSADDVRLRNEAFNTASENLYAKITELGKMQSDYAKAAVENIDQYYSVLLSREQQVAKTIEETRKNLELEGAYDRNGNTLLDSYQQSIDNRFAQMRILQEAIIKEEAQVNQALASHWWELNDEDYISAQNHIEELRNQINQLNLDTTSLYQNMIDLPSKIAEERISRINAEAVVDEKGNVKLPDEADQKNRIKDVRFGALLTAQRVLDTAQSEEMRRIAQLNLDRVKQEYIDALREANEAAEKAEDDMIAKAKQSVLDIEEYYNRIINSLETLSNAYSKFRDDLDELGRSMDENGNLITDTAQITASYTLQIDALNEKLQEQSNKRKALKIQIESVTDVLGEESDEYRELQNVYVNSKIEIMDTIIELDKLKDAFREATHFKPFEEAIENLKTLRSNLDSVNSLINDQMKVTSEGTFTQLGKVSLALDVSNYVKSLEIVDQASEEYYKNQERHAFDASYSDEEYLKKSQTIREQLLQGMAEVNSARQAIVEAEKSRYQEEINYLKKLIDAQKDELSKKKELADYDKNLKNKTKAVQQIEMEIRALQGLTDAQSQAQLKRLQEQRAEAEDDLNETVEEHVLELRQQGLDDFATKVDEGFDNWVTNLDKNVSSVIDMINATSDKVSANIGESDAALQQYLKTFGTNITTNMVTGLTNGLSTSGELNIPNKDEIKSAANMLVKYYDGYTAKTFDEKISAIQDDTSKQREAARNLFEQQDEFEQQRIAETAVDRAYKIQRDATLDAQNTGLMNEIDLASDTLVVGLKANADSIKAAQEAVAEKNKDDTTELLNNLDTNYRPILENVADYTSQATDAIADSSEEITQNVEYQGTNIPAQINEAIDTARETIVPILTGINDGLNAESALGQSASYTVDGINSMFEELQGIHGEYDPILEEINAALGEDGVLSGEVSYISTQAEAIVDEATKIEGEYFDALSDIDGRLMDAQTVIANEISYTAEATNDIGTKLNAIKGEYSSVLADIARGISELSNRNERQQAEDAEEMFEPVYTHTNTATQYGVTVPNNLPATNTATSNSTASATTATNNSASSNKPQNATYVKVTTSDGKSRRIDRNVHLLITETMGKARAYNMSQKEVFDTIVRRGKFEIPDNLAPTAKARLQSYNETRTNGTIADIKAFINTLIDQYPNKFFGVQKYAKGTLNAAKGLGQVWENGPEIITTARGTFVPFKGGEGVIPAKQTQAILNLAKAVETGKFELQLPDMSAYEPLKYATGGNVSNSSNIQIDSLITINGNATEETVNQIKEIANSLVRNKQFQENVTKFVSQRQAADGRMAGKRINVK